PKTPAADTASARSFSINRTSIMGQHHSTTGKRSIAARRARGKAPFAGLRDTSRPFEHRLQRMNRRAHARRFDTHLASLTLVDALRGDPAGGPLHRWSALEPFEGDLERSIGGAAQVDGHTGAVPIGTFGIGRTGIGQDQANKRVQAMRADRMGG